MTKDEFEAMAPALRAAMCVVARRYMPSADDADDVVQDAMLRLWGMHSSLCMPVQPLARAVVRNMCIDWLRRHKHLPSTDDEHSAATLTDTSPEDEAHRESIERMMAIVNQLPDLQQLILRLRHIDGMQMHEIAQLTGTSEVALRKALSRARQKVRDAYLKQNNMSPQ